MFKLNVPQSQSQGQIIITQVNKLILFYITQWIQTPPPSQTEQRGPSKVIYHNNNKNLQYHL